jgi:hypothetical protein
VVVQRLKAMQKAFRILARAFWTIQFHLADDLRYEESTDWWRRFFPVYTSHGAYSSTFRTGPMSCHVDRDVCGAYRCEYRIPLAPGFCLKAISWYEADGYMIKLEHPFPRTRAKARPVVWEDDELPF